MGEYEGFTLVVRETFQESTGLDRTVLVGCRRLCGLGGRIGSSAGPFADVFEAHVAGHTEHPGDHGTALPPVEMCDDAQQRLLGEVIGLAGPGEVGAEPPHVGLNRAHERVERLTVPRLGVGREVVQVQHPTILSSGAGTPCITEVTRWVVDCEQTRVVLSAQLDQEASPIEAGAANAHLGRCLACRDWWADIGRLNRVLRVRIAEPVPDIATPVLARVHPPRTGRGQWVRIALALVAASELVLAAPGLVLGDGAAAVHDARHLGSFGVAVSIGLLYVAWRPARAFGILPIVTALALTMLVSATIDVVHGRVTSFGEAHHVLEFSGLVLV